MIFANNYIFTFGNGIRLTNPGPNAYGDIIQGNYIVAGLCGVELANQGFNLVEGNAISGKVGIYVRTSDTANYNIISGNGLSCSLNAIKHNSAARTRPMPIMRFIREPSKSFPVIPRWRMPSKPIALPGAPKRRPLM